MKTKILFFSIIYFLFLNLFTFAQEDKDLNLNLLKAPSSPGFIILGIEPTSIERPTDPNSFKLSILNATENLTTLPKNYCLEFSPGWLFFGKNITVEKFRGNNFLDNIIQGTAISFGVITSKNADSVEGSSVGIGFKTSLFRGTEINDEASRLKQANRDTLRRILNNKFSIEFETLLKNDTQVILYDSLINENLIKLKETTVELISKQYTEIIALYIKFKNERVALLKKDYDILFEKRYKETIDNLKKQASEINFVRYGFKLDLAGGLAMDFPDRRINYSKVTKCGFWITTGYDFKDKWSCLLVSRFLASPEKEIETSPGIKEKKTIWNMDIGTRIIKDAFSKFSFSGEMIYRRIFNANISEKEKLKYVFITNYELDKNIVLSFSIGKEFETKPKASGNLILVLNLIMGFGNNRPIF